MAMARVLEKSDEVLEEEKMGAKPCVDLEEMDWVQGDLGILLGGCS
jgi:hypothetical protein